MYLIRLFYILAIIHHVSTLNIYVLERKKITCVRHVIAGGCVDGLIGKMQIFVPALFVLLYMSSILPVSVKTHVLEDVLGFLGTEIANCAILDSLKIRQRLVDTYMHRCYA